MGPVFEEEVERLDGSEPIPAVATRGWVVEVVTIVVTV